MLKIRNLSFRFGLRTILKGLDLDLNDGDCLHIVGENGSGKSTLLQLLSGRHTPTSGELIWTANKPPYRSFLGAESNGLYMQLSALENLQVPLRLQGKLTSDCTHTLQVRLESWGLKTPFVQNSLPIKKFSTGMRRRLALCRIEMSHSPLWILDEPLNGLDSAGTKQFAECLKRKLASKQGAVVLTGHQKMMDEVLPPQSRKLAIDP